MKQKLLTSLVLIFLAGTALAAQKAADLYQQALVQERGVGDLEKAIDLFQRAAKEAGSDHELGAKALLGAARCYEKMGQAKAWPLYAEVVQNYSDQRDLAATAQQHLEAIQRANESTAKVAESQALDQRNQVSVQIELLRAQLGRMSALAQQGIVRPVDVDNFRNQLRAMDAEVERL